MVAIDPLEAESRSEWWRSRVPVFAVGITILALAFWLGQEPPPRLSAVCAAGYQRARTASDSARVDSLAGNGNEATCRDERGALAAWQSRPLLPN